jgi:hypothetical protein
MFAPLEQPSAFSYQLSAKVDNEFVTFSLDLSEQFNLMKGFNHLPGEAES